MLLETALAVIFGTVGVLTPVRSAQAMDLPPIPPNLEERVCAIADLHNVSCGTLLNILDGEHYGKEWRDGSENEVVSKTGDYGLCQIHIEIHGITKEQAFSPNFCINWMAKAIADGHESYWTECSCVQYLRARGYNLPRIKTPAELIPNTIPAKGVIALFHYKNADHMAEVIEITQEGFSIREANFERCKLGKRFIKWNDPALRGFWKARESG